jgi:hypothetical protein
VNQQRRRSPPPGRPSPWVPLITWFRVIERDVANRVDEMVRLRDALPPLGVPVDVIVLSEDQAAKWARVKGTMVCTALAEGRVVAES